MFESEDSWQDFEVMIDEFSDSETPNESASTEAAVFPNWKDIDSDSELYFSDSAMSEDSQLNFKLMFYSCAANLLSISLFRDQASTRRC